ncbi:kinase-like protein [Patellaria atrata CBS 101060]|uniref:Kinase-like protein n=1 Tax=Patellaria atrata CBS 101060 TaxID=1346257 RepID=A0A9P4VPN1_9PEZI|nr:kinase-like protein [Patellaria atrata CBS 101060]
MDCMRNNFVKGAVLDGRFETISPLNHGSFGMVFMAKDLATGESVALKCLTKNTAENICPSAFAIDDQSEELSIHLAIRNHPNIVNLIHSFETANHVYLVLEFCSNGDLYEAIRLGKGPLETEHVREFMFQLVDAVEFLHTQGIAHRDIKPENIFLTQSGSMKLGDFGLATRDHWSYEAAVGSDRYMAPEQYDPSTSGYSPAEADIWAIGICLLNVLFSRNPFTTPTLSDPLFADFAGDRQTLFDVFPNMSQDTFEVLDHCLVIDPSKRSLRAVREALDRVIGFTTDDESLDEFCCADDHHVVPATANREPLRTPSVSNPQVEPNGSFPWAKALAMSPPLPVRQLSVIPDTERYPEDIFAGSEHSEGWFHVKPDNASLASFVDSGLGVSYKSVHFQAPQVSKITRSKPMPIAGSLPVSMSKRLPSFASGFGKKRELVSKSWSDLWDEEEEEMHAVIESENVFGIHTEETTEPVLSRNPTNTAHSSGRNGLVELKNPIVNSRNTSPKPVPKADNHVSEHTGFIFEEHHAVVPRYSPPSKKTLMDKWAALGDRRRAKNTQTASAPMIQSPSQTSRKRSKTGSWKRKDGIGFHHGNHSGVWARNQEWNLSKDWRQHDHHNSGDDVGDIEWVGGWNDLHL